MDGAGILGTPLGGAAPPGKRNRNVQGFLSPPHRRPSTTVLLPSHPGTRDPCTGTHIPQHRFSRTPVLVSLHWH